MLRTLSLRTQLMLLQLSIVLTVVLVAGAVALTMLEQQIRDAYEAKMVGVAQSVARLPSIVDAFDDPDPSSTIQPIAEVITQSTEVTYVVVTDAEGIRYSHANPERIGERVSTDPSIPLSGEIYVGTQTGTLGESWRVKVPVFDPDGSEVIGTVSVGTLESLLHADLTDDLPVLLAWLVIAALAGSGGAIYVSRLVWRRIYQLEPEEIAALLETRDAMIHGIGEGVVAVDERGRVALVNDEATRLLAPDGALAGRAAADVLDPALVAMATTSAEQDETVLVGERMLLVRATAATVDGHRVGSVLILRDRTELHQLLQDLDGARDAAQALRAQAHEFSNRMHIISGLLELDQVREAIDYIERTGHGGAVVGGNTAPGITDPVVASLLMAKTSICEERGIRLVVAPDSAADPDGTDDVATVIGNLVDNAMDVSGHGDTIRVSLAQDLGGITVSVQDEGAGVPTGQREAIFTAGHSSKAERGARGFGLALVARISQRREGWVRVETPDGGGARFTVRLSSAPAAADPAGWPGTQQGAPVA